MENKTNNIREGLKKQKSFIGYIFIAILVIQFGLFSSIKNYDSHVRNIYNDSQKVDCELQLSIIKNEVRPQIRRSLEAIRESWVIYLQHNKTELLMKDKAGKYIYSNEVGNRIVYDDSTMRKVKRPDKYFDIYDKGDNHLLKTRVRPEWNTENVKAILDTIASPVRAFGPSGDTIIFDTNTGEIIIDNSEDCKDSTQVLGKDHKRYVTLDDKHPNNKNPQMTKDLIKNHYLWKSDSDSTTEMVYMFNEPTQMDEPNNFLKYPLGKYNREFQEKIILPYQTVGVDGQDMQITIVLGAQEKEIYSAYKNVFAKYRNLYDDAYKKNLTLIYIPTLSVFMSLIVMAITFFALKINTYMFKRDIEKIRGNKEGEK